MDMEATERTMMEKVNSIDYLPGDYAPNLQSKWELLDAGLRPQRKRHAWIYFLGSGIAAAILLLFGPAILLQQQKKSPASLPRKTAGEQLEQGFKNAGVADAKPGAKYIPKKQKVKQALPEPAQQKAEMMVTVAAETDSLAGLPEEKNVMLAEVPKAKRFTEIDFDQPAIGNRAPDGPVIASQRFRFKIGVGAQTNSTKPAGLSPLRFTTPLN
jgi:hypothetical protein